MAHRTTYMMQLDERRLARLRAEPDPAKLRERRVVVAAFVAILLLGAGLRLPGITRTSPVLWDDAYMFLEARQLASVASAAVDSIGRKLAEERSGEDLWKRGDELAAIRAAADGEPPFYGRPLHNAMTLAVFAVAGDRTWAGNLASALLGIATLPVMFAIGRRLGGAPAGLLAMAALALSGYHVQYSREAFSESTSVFFLALAVLAYLRSRAHLLDDPVAGTGLAGLAFGATLLCHARWAIYLPLLLACELQLARSVRDGWSKAWARTIRIVAFTLLPLAIVEAPYYGLMLLDRHLDQPIGARTWVEQNLYQFALGSGGGFGTGNWPTYPYLFVKLSGFAFVLATVLGAAQCAARRGLERIVPIGLLVIPLVLFSSSRVAHMRYGVVMTFAAAIVIGVGFGGAGSWVRRLVRRKRRQGWIVAAVLVGLASVEMGVHALAGARLRYAYPEAMAWMEEHGGLDHVSTQAFVSEVFTHEGGTLFVPEDFRELERAVAEGRRYLLVDIGLEALRYNPKLEKRFAVAERAMEGREPVATFPAPDGPFLQPKFEMNFDFRGSLAFIDEAAERGANTIRIYDLTDPPLR